MASARYGLCGAQRRPERQPRLHTLMRSRSTIRIGPLNEGRSVNPGYTRAIVLVSVMALHRSTKAGALTPATLHPRLAARRCLAFAAQDRHQTPPAAVAVQITHRFIAFKCSYLFFAAFTCLTSAPAASSPLDSGRPGKKRTSMRRSDTTRHDTAPMLDAAGHGRVRMISASQDSPRNKLRSVHKQASDTRRTGPQPAV